MLVQVQSLTKRNYSKIDRKKHTVTVIIKSSLISTAHFMNNWLKLNKKLRFFEHADNRIGGNIYLVKKADFPTNSETIKAVAYYFVIFSNYSLGKPWQVPYR